MNLVITSSSVRPSTSEAVRVISEDNGLLLIVLEVVTKLEVFDSFNSLVDKYDMKDIYLENASREDYLKLMERFYSKEDEIKYGVLAISYEVM